MTQNQINFAKLKEDIRHNQATEKYTGIELNETVRHNVQQENLNWYNAGELAGHYQRQDTMTAEELSHKNPMYDAQTSSYAANASKLLSDADVNRKKQELEEYIARNGSWKDVQEAANKAEANFIARKNAEITETWYKQQVNWMANQFNFDKEKYYKSEMWKDVSQSIRNITAAGKDVAGILDQFLDSIVQFIG